MSRIVMEKASGMGEEDGKEAMVKVSIEEQNGRIGPEDRGMQKKVWKGRHQKSK